MFFDIKYWKIGKPTNRQLTTIRRIEKGDRTVETVLMTSLAFAAMLLAMAWLWTLGHLFLKADPGSIVTDHYRSVLTAIIAPAIALLVTAGVSSVILGWRKHASKSLIASDDVSELGQPYDNPLSLLWTVAERHQQDPAKRRELFNQHPATVNAFLTDQKVADAFRTLGANPDPESKDKTEATLKEYAEVATDKFPHPDRPRQKPRSARRRTPSSTS